jgi:ABC-type Fe3+/spermidine/putrescine transport system ATPase subunit
LVDEIVVMNNAVIEQAGTAYEVFNAPKTEFVARFMGEFRGQIRCRRDDRARRRQDRGVYHRH